MWTNVSASCDATEFCWQTLHNFLQHLRPCHKLLSYLRSFSGHFLPNNHLSSFDSFINSVLSSCSAPFSCTIVSLGCPILDDIGYNSGRDTFYDTIWLFCTWEPLVSMTNGSWWTHYVAAISCNRLQYSDGGVPHQVKVCGTWIQKYITVLHIT